MIQQLEQSGKDIFWQGEASESSILQLESLGETRLPTSFRRFLRSHGGGVVAGEEISRIEDDDPAFEFRGTGYGDTFRCRENYGLPRSLVIIYFGDDDVVRCLDASRHQNDENPVVSFDLFLKQTRLIAENFDEFLAEDLRLRIPAGL